MPPRGVARARRKNSKIDAHENKISYNNIKIIRPRRTENKLVILLSSGHWH